MLKLMYILPIFWNDGEIKTFANKQNFREFLPINLLKKSAEDGLSR